MLLSKIAKPVCGITLGITLFSFTGMAQKITLTSSTEQCWSGGVAGRHGCNYNFIIDFRGSTPTPDTIWVGDYPIALVERNEKPPTEGNMKITRTKDKIRFDIAAATYFNDQEDHNGPHPPEGVAPAVKPAPPRKYKGVALLSYRIRGKRCFYEVPKFMERKPHISYP